LGRKRDIIFAPHVNIINKKIRAIIATDISNGKILKFSNIREIELLGFNKVSVYRSCNNRFAKRKNIYKGYKWEFDKCPDLVQ
jgi:TolB-like protein